MQAVRGYLPSLIGAMGPREMRRAEPRLKAGADLRRGLVGAGGRADEANRRPPQQG